MASKAQIKVLKSLLAQECITKNQYIKALGSNIYAPKIIAGGLCNKRIKGL